MPLNRRREISADKTLSDRTTRKLIGDIDLRKWSALRKRGKLCVEVADRRSRDVVFFPSVLVLRIRQSEHSRRRDRVTPEPPVPVARPGAAAHAG
jgi:hypothetical protein